MLDAALAADAAAAAAETPCEWDDFSSDDLSLFLARLTTSCSCNADAKAQSD